MDDTNAFEHLVAEEVQVEAGPSRPTDVAAVVRSVATKSPRWRFLSMFSATKTLAGAAFVALFGGLLLAGPLTPLAQDPDPASGSAAATVHGEPVEFEARWVYGSGSNSDSSGFESLGDRWMSLTNLSWAPGIRTAGDSRLDGRLELVASSAQRHGLEIWNGAFRVENDEGAWQQRPMIQSVKLSDASEPMTWTAVFDGEGDYEGLAAVAGITRAGGGWDVKGVIVDAAVLPEKPTALDLD